LAAYPVYFTGDIREPINKIIFIGINPGFDEKKNREEQAFLRNRGLYEGYCRIYADFFGRGGKQRLIPYYANIAGFLRRFYEIKEKMDWFWFQEHFIALELVPYHSANTGGLRINNIKRYRYVYFEIILKILAHLNPQEPIFINGFPTWRRLIEKKKGQLLPEFSDIIEVRHGSNFVTGTIDRKYRFIGVPFLTRVKGGKDALVAAIKETEETSLVFPE